MPSWPVALRRMLDGYHDLSSTLRGTVQAPPSKSAAHRAMICAALADGPTVIQMGGPSEDIRATGNCLTALRRGNPPFVGWGPNLPIKTAPRRAVLDCGGKRLYPSFSPPLSRQYCPRKLHLPGAAVFRTARFPPWLPRWRRKAARSPAIYSPFTVYGPFVAGLLYASRKHQLPIFFRPPVCSADARRGQ